MNNADMTAVTLGFVRGERDWRSLEDIGVSIALRDGQVAVVGSVPTPIVAKAQDVAAGWLHHADRKDVLRTWAQIVMGAVGLIELDLRETGDEDALKEALWTVSFGGAPTAAMERVARRILVSAKNSAPNP
jgi:hypothetical protein